MAFYKKPKAKDFSEISKTEQLKMAIASSLNILGAKEQTEATLREKLEARGHDDDVIDAAIGYLTEKRYLDEERYLARYIKVCAENKLYGRVRILQELKQKGFSKKALEQADFSEIDFGVLCAKRLGKYRRANKAAARSSEECFEELSPARRREMWQQRQREKQKEYAALVRYGYSGRDIARAYEVCGEKHGESTDE